jgi:DNA-directed RNA polymerase specialized sigma24 family protein
MLFDDWLNDLEKKIYIHLCDLENLSADELSARLKMPVDTVHILLRRMVEQGKINSEIRVGIK